jgi:hypothetical protein
MPAIGTVSWVVAIASLAVTVPVGQTSAFGGVGWPPAIEYRDYSTARVYAVADRGRHCAGEPVATRRITFER